MDSEKFGRIGDGFVGISLVLYLVYLNSLAEVWVFVVLIFAVGTFLNFFDKKYWNKKKDG